MADSEDDAGKAPPEATDADAGHTQAIGGPTVPIKPEAEVPGSRETSVLSSGDIAGTSPVEPATRRQASSASGAGGGPRHNDPTFAPNAVLANRYRIVRFIAQGAMGEVYEAEDTALRGRVALKTVRPEIAEDPQAVARFKREIALARLVTHPNVSRIYDLGLHTPAGPATVDSSLDALVSEEGETAKAPGQVLFLTMELLLGETLSSFLARRRRLKRTEALPLLKQISAGLDAAHAVGVIHRDFKSGNVMLVSAGDPRKPVRAVVTDFGLARDMAGGSALASISDTGTVVGTPAYMAPEQVEGMQLTPAADIYALGIVVYEMVTGVRPFDGGSAITVAVRRLREAPAPPRAHVPDVHPGWEAAILRCLQIDPTARFATAGDFVGALETPSTTVDIADLPTKKMEQPAPVVPAAPPPRAPSSAWLAVAVAAALVLGGVALWRSRGTTPATPAPNPAPASPTAVATPFVPRRALAVLGLENASGAPSAAWLSTAIAEMLSTDLAAGGQIRALPGHDVARARTDLGITALHGVSADQAAVLRRRLGADLLVTGTYTLTAGAPTRLLRVDLRLFDATNGALLAQGGATGNEGQLFDIVFRAGAALREKLGLGRIAPTEVLQVEAVLPANPEAARLYVQGLERLRRADAQGARGELEKAITLAPKHPLPHAALATAWTALGFDAKARKEAKEAAGLGGALPTEMRSAIEARVHEAAKDWDPATKAYAALAASFPDDLDYGLKLAEVQTLGGQAKEAMVTIETLRKLPVPVASDPRIDLAHARAFQELGEAKNAEAKASQAAEKAKAMGAPVLEARALALQSTARHNQGDTKGGVAAAEGAKKLFEAAGDRGWAARCLERMAIGLHAQGDLRGARRLHQSALAVHRQIGDVGSVARVLNNMATDSLNEGKLAEAQGLLDQALVAFRQVDAKYEAAATLSNIGARLYTAGDLGSAQRRYQQALSLFQELGEKSGIATTLTNLAEVYFVRADLARAQQLHEEALAINREIGDKAGAGYSLFRLGELFTARGDLKVGRDRYDEAQRLQGEAGDKLGAAQTRLGLAALTLAEGQATAAEPLARESEEVLRAEGAVDLQALALVTLGESLLAQKKIADAKAASEKAQALLENADRRTGVAAAVLAARLQAGSGQAADLAAAIASLTAALADATRSGLVPSQYEARLALGRVEVAAGKAAEGRARLKALARDAGAAGFGLLAKQAQGS